MIAGVAEAAQEVSSEEINACSGCSKLSCVIPTSRGSIHRPPAPAARWRTGPDAARFAAVAEATPSAQRVRGHQPTAGIAKVEGAKPFLQATQDITVSGRASRQPSIPQSADVGEMIAWSENVAAVGASTDRGYKATYRRTHRKSILPSAG